MRKGKAAPMVYVKPKKQKQSDYVNIKASFYENYVSLILRCENIKLNGNVPLIDTVGNKFRLKEIIGEKGRLVFRFSFADCDLCIRSCINSIKEFVNDSLVNNILIITDSFTERDFKLKMAAENYGLKVYTLSDELLGLFLEGKNLPFLFYLDEDLITHKVFLPFKEYPENTREYIQYILSEK